MEQIVDLFYKNVKGIDISLSKTTKHCGKEGHWLEKQMECSINSMNLPDLLGYEMKKNSSTITLGDFSASEYAFSRKRSWINETNQWTNDVRMTRNEFIHYFGNPNKNGRYSWSGSSVPKYNVWNPNGQILHIDDTNNIIIYYSWTKDTRDIKNNFPDFLKKDVLVIAVWRKDKMASHINNKFNDKGFFICHKIKNKYEKIFFGKSFNFEYFIECIKNKKVIFDSGMYEGNTRNYSMFRGSSFWKELIIQEY